MDFATLVFKADSRQLKDGKKVLGEVADQAGLTEQKTTKLGNSMKKYLTFAAIAGGAALLTREILRTAQAMDDTIKTSRMLSVGVEAFQELKYAAELSGVSTEGLSTSLRYLNQNLYNNHKSFDALGLSVKKSNGDLKSAEDMLPEIADKFADMEDGAKKTAVAQEMFGRSGVQMINMLKDGSAGLQEMAQEARNLGIIFDQETAQKAELFNDNLTRLGKTKEGMFTQLTANLLPAFVNLTDEITNASQGASVMDGITEGLTHVIKGLTVGVIAVYFSLKSVADLLSTALASSIGIISTMFKSLADVIGSVAYAVVQFVNRDFSGAWTTLKDGFGNAFDEIKNGLEEQKHIWADGAGDIKKNFEDATRVIGGMFDEIDMEEQERKLSLYRDTAGATTDQLDGMTDAEKRLAEAMKEAEIIRRSTLNPLEQYAEAVDHLNKTFLDSEMSFDTYDRALAQLEGNLQQSQQREIDSLYRGLLTEEEMINQSYERRMAAILESTAITATQKADLELLAEAEKNDKLKALQEDYSESNAGIYSEMFGSISSIMKSAGKEHAGIYKAMFAVSKAFAIAESLMKINVGTASSASVGWPQNIATVAGHLASTAGIVASIKSTNFAGNFDKGGSIPSGMYGIAGERGAEIVQGPATVTSTNDTADIMKGRGDTVINVYDQSGGLVESVRKKVRSHEMDTVIDEISARMKERAV